ncbi:MAG: hypothetical protein ABH864_07440 [archaeon]
MLDYALAAKRINFYDSRLLDEEIERANLQGVLLRVGVDQAIETSRYKEFIFVGEGGYCRYEAEGDSLHLMDFTIGLPNEIIIRDARRSLASRLDGTDVCLVVTGESVQEDVSVERLSGPSKSDKEKQKTKKRRKRNSTS